MTEKNIKKVQLEHWLAGILLLILLILCLWAWRTGIFRDLETLQGYVECAGVAAPLLAVFLHLIQILIPFIPGGVVLTAVVIVFGPWHGFVINFSGILLGSSLSFALARYFGKDFVRKRIKPETWQKYFRWLDNEKLFRRMFLLLILLPFAPDDALCMLAGISKISVRDFLLILFFCKIPMVLVYTLGMIGADVLL